MAEEYDLLVIGGGAAGSTAATTAAEAGRRVALVERDKLGGTCLNYGCDPTKALLHVAHELYHARYAEHYGLRIPSAEADWAAVLAWVDKVIQKIRGGTPEEARASVEAQGVTLLMGDARFLSPHEAQVGDVQIRAKQIIVATGGETAVPSIEGLKETGFITNVEAVALPELPQRMAIIGGGPIGLEFAQLFHRFGVEVTVLEVAPQLLGKDDRELADRLCGLLGAEGILLETGVELRRVEQAEDGKRIALRCGERGEEILVVDEILLAAGRRPRIETLQLDRAGVETNKQGIVVDETLRTNVAHIWAAGDVTGRFPFTHVASEQAKLAAQNAFAREPRAFDYRAMPWVTYTEPALAHVGKTEEELKEEGVEYRVARMEFEKLDRAIAEGVTEGLMKLLVDEEGLLLGGHVLAPNAGDLLAPIVVAMRAGLPASTLAETILPYPTMAEAVRWAADKLKD